MKKITLFLFLILSFNFYAQKESLTNISQTKEGFIGIGTTTPDALLTVNGNIHTREVLVDLDGAVAPDYVFELYYNGFSNLKKEYRFLSLIEIENFIKTNHHLPGVPSAKKMDEDGVSLKEMNLLLLEKVEELTLHLIEQQKQLTTLNNRVQELENSSE